MPTDPKLDHLSSYLIDFYLKTIISPESLKRRYDIYHTFKLKFLSKHPDATVNVYGSTAHGICFPDSSCDISVESGENDKSTHQILTEVADLIQKEMSDIFDCQKQQKANNKLTVQLKNSSTCFNFTTALHTSAHKTSALLKAYIELDDRVKVLAMCFRYMAKV